jgi:2-phospho-L-lactate/phosphoenolpyruvate guanylyltransferase
MRVVVPFAVDRPKTRLAGFLDPEERLDFARAMLGDVLDGLEEAGYDPEVLATASFDTDRRSDLDPSVPVRVDERALTPAVNAVLERASGPVAVVMADLPLVTPAALSRLFAARSAGAVVLAPGRGGGTNALVSSHPDFRVDYHGASMLDHERGANAIGARPRTIDSFRLAADIDEPADLPEILLHAGESRAARWLRRAGVSLSITDGRVGVARSPE